MKRRGSRVHALTEETPGFMGIKRGLSSGFEVSNQRWRAEAEA